MNYNKLIEDLKETEVNLNMIKNRLEGEYTKENMNYDVAQIMITELYKTYRHIQQLLFLMESGGKMVIKQVIEEDK